MEELDNLNVFQVIDKIYEAYGNPPNGVTENREGFFARNRAYWYYTVKCLGRFVANIKDIPDLQSVIYGKRQEAEEAYHNLLSIISKMTEEYKVKYNTVYDKIRMMKIPNTPNYVYNTDGALRSKIDGELASDKYLIDIAENHARYLDDTVKGIDAIIYAIPNRIRLEELKIGK